MGECVRWPATFGPWQHVACSHALEGSFIPKHHVLHDNSQQARNPEPQTHADLVVGTSGFEALNPLLHVLGSKKNPQILSFSLHKSRAACVSACFLDSKVSSLILGCREITWLLILFIYIPSRMCLIGKGILKSCSVLSFRNFMNQVLHVFQISWGRLRSWFPDS